MASNLPATSSENIANQRIFNGTFFQEIPIDENTHSIVYGFFLGKTGLKESADSLTQSLLSVCYNNKFNPIDILKEFDKATTESNFKKILIGVFNTGRNPTSKIGYSKGTSVNKWVARNIVS
jgi:hypothetical protein